MARLRDLGVVFAASVAVSFQGADAIKCAVSLPGGIVMATDFSANTAIDRCVQFTPSCTAESTEFYCLGFVATHNPIPMVYGAASADDCTKNAGKWTCTTGDWSNKPASWTAANTGDAQKTCYMGTGFGLADDTIPNPSAVLDTGKCVRFQVTCDPSVFGCNAEEQATKAPRWMYGSIPTEEWNIDAVPNKDNVGSYLQNYFSCDVSAPDSDLCNPRITPARLRCYAGATESDDGTTTGPQSYFYNACQAGQTDCSFSEACQKYQVKCSPDMIESGGQWVNKDERPNQSFTVVNSKGATIKVCNQAEIDNQVYKWIYTATTWETCASNQVNPPSYMRNSQCCSGALCNTPEYPKGVTCWNGVEYKTFPGATYPLRDWSEEAFDSCVALRFSCAAPDANTPEDVKATLEALQQDPKACSEEQKLIGEVGGQFGAINADKCEYLQNAIANDPTLSQVYQKVECCKGDRCNGPKDYPPVMCWNGQEDKIFTNTNLFDQASARSKCLKYKVDCEKVPAGFPGSELCTKPNGSGQKVWTYGATTPSTCTKLEDNKAAWGLSDIECCDGKDTESCNKPPSKPAITCWSDKTNKAEIYANDLLDEPGFEMTQCLSFKINCGDANLPSNFKTDYCTGVTGDKWVLGAVQKRYDSTAAASASTCKIVQGLEGKNGVYPGTTSCCTPKDQDDVCNGPKDYPPLTCFDGTTQKTYENTQLFAASEAVSSCFKGQVDCTTTNTAIKTAAGCKTGDQFKWFYGKASVSDDQCAKWKALEGSVFKTGTTLCCQEDGCNSAVPLKCVESFGGKADFNTTNHVSVDSSDTKKDRCFAYRMVCSLGDDRCTEAEQEIGAIKYVAGATNMERCKMLASLPSVYHNLECCQEDLCNSPTDFKLSCSVGTDAAGVVQTEKSSFTTSNSDICYSYGEAGAKTFGFTSESDCQKFVKDGKANVVCCAEDCTYTTDGSNINTPTTNPEDDNVSAGNRRRSLLGEVMSWFA